MTQALFDPETGEVAIPECPYCADHLKTIVTLERDLQLVERELRNERREVEKLKTELRNKRKAHIDAAKADAIFRYWVARLGKRDKVAVFGEKREKAVLARLAQYEPSYIARAIDGLAVGHYVSPEGKHYDDLELVCRDEVHLERYHEIAERTEAPTLAGPAWLKEFDPGIGPDSDRTGA